MVHLIKIAHAYYWAFKIKHFVNKLLLHEKKLAKNFDFIHLDGINLSLWLVMCIKIKNDQSQCQNNALKQRKKKLKQV